jgi:hypothetical protein
MVGSRNSPQLSISSNPDNIIVKLKATAAQKPTPDIGLPLSSNEAMRFAIPRQAVPEYATCDCKHNGTCHCGDHDPPSTSKS